MINAITLEGRFTDMPELRETTSGKKFCKFSLAHDAGYGDKKRSEYYACIAWDKLAELICTYFYKGNSITVFGQMTQSKYTDKDNNTKVSYTVNVSEISFAGAHRPEKEKKIEEKFTEENAPVFEDISGDDDLPF